MERVTLKAQQEDCARGERREQKPEIASSLTLLAMTGFAGRASKESSKSRFFVALTGFSPWNGAGRMTGGVASSGKCRTRNEIIDRRSEILDIVVPMV